MRVSDPTIEKRFLARLLAKPLATRIVELVTNPVYAVKRVRERWYECSHPEHPLLTRGAIEFLERNFKSDMTGFEWGSGGSTLWFARNSKHLVSIEHDQRWYDDIQTKLRTLGLGNVDYRQISLEHPESEPTSAVYDPVPRYVAEIDQFPDRSFDYCLIDGHYRLACLRAALPKIKPGGLLIVDDTHWMSLTEWGAPSDWHIATRSPSDLKETTILRRPLASAA